MTHPSIAQSPEVLGGEPVFTGSRVPIRSFFDHLAAGDSIEDFLDGFPSIRREQIIALPAEPGVHPGGVREISRG